MVSSIITNREFKCGNWGEKEVIEWLTFCNRRNQYGTIGS